MNIELLRCFLEVTRYGSVTAAAKALNINQPTLSRQIRRLEAEWGVQLLERSVNGVVLTTEGKVALSGVESTLRSYDALTAKVAGVTQGQPLRLGMTPVAMELLLDELMARLHRAGNPLRLSISEGFNANLLDGVRLGKLDLAIATAPDPIPGLQSHILWTEQVYIAGRAAFPLPRTTTIEDAARLPLVLGRPDDTIRQAIEQAFLEHDQKLTAALEMEGITSIKRLLEKQDLWTFAPWLAIRNEVESGKLVCSAVEGLLIQRHVVTPTGSDAKPHIRAVVRLLRELSNRLLASQYWARLPD